VIVMVYDTIQSVKLCELSAVVITITCIETCRSTYDI